MSTAFMPRNLVNASMLRQYEGENVSIMLRVEDAANKFMTGKSTDNHKVRVQLSEPLAARIGNWVEVIGQSMQGGVRCKEMIPFSGENIDFDEEGYNMMVQFMNNCKEIYRHG